MTGPDTLVPGLRTTAVALIEDRRGLHRTQIVGRAVDRAVIDEDQLDTVGGMPLERVNALLREVKLVVERDH